MKLSARTVLKGRVVEDVRGATTAHVKIDIGGGSVRTASITNEAVEELKVAKGDVAYAVLKASDVMVPTSEAAPARRSPPATPETTAGSRDRIGPRTAGSSAPQTSLPRSCGTASAAGGADPRAASPHLNG